MTTIRSDNETHCGLNQEQEHTVVCVPPTPSPEVPRKKDGSSEYVKLVYTNTLSSARVSHMQLASFIIVYTIYGKTFEGNLCDFGSFSPNHECFTTNS